MPIIANHTFFSSVKTKELVEYYPNILRMNRSYFLLLFCFAFFDSNVWAQKEQDATEKLYGLTLEELMNVTVSTASKKLERVSETPNTTITISKQDIIDRGYANLKDIFHDLPGMNAFEYSYAEQGTIVPIRGIVGNQKFIILLNGIRVNPAGGEEFKLNSDFSIRGAKQIEIVYGPGSTLYGQDGISAIINVITEDAEDQAQFETQLIGGMNSHLEFYSNYSSPIKKEGVTQGVITAMLQYTTMDLDNREKTNPDWSDQINDLGGIAENVRFDEGFSGFLKLESGQSSLQLFHRESKRSSSDGGFANVLYFQPEAIWHDRSTTIEARNTLDFTDKIHLESSFSLSRYEIDPDSRFVFPADSESFFLDDYKYAVGTRSSLEEKLSWQIADKVAIIAGLVAVSSDVLPKATVPGKADTGSDISTQAGTWDYITSSGDSMSVQRVNNVLFQQLGGYSEVQIKPTDRLRLCIGLRSDVSTLYEEKPFSPRAAIIYNFADNLVAKYTYSQAFVNPAPYFGLATAFDGANLITLNENVEPEKAKSHEINLSCFKNIFSFSFSGYYNVQDNLILIGENAHSANIIDDNVIFNGEVIRLTQTVNQGSSFTYGLDVYGRAKVDRTSFWGSYSFVDGEIEELGEENNLLEQNVISAHNVRLGVTYDFSTQFAATLSGKISSTPKGISNYENLFGLEKELKTPYQVNLHANYFISNHFRAFVNIQNLTNHTYAMRGVRNPVLAEQMKAVIGLSFSF